ncbi:MAG: type II toxin-antitoxin system VapC family toxin [Isosphaeraceae bacterium]
MRCVLDSSVAFKWVVIEPFSDKARNLRDELRQGLHELIAPDIFPIEVAHSLTRAERQGRISPPEASILLAEVLLTCPQLHPYMPLLLHAVAISSQARIGVYDCLYVALAQREGCEFLTADDRLIRALRPSFPFITPLSSLP